MSSQNLSQEYYRRLYGKGKRCCAVCAYWIEGAASDGFCWRFPAPRGTMTIDFCGCWTPCPKVPVDGQKDENVDVHHGGKKRHSKEVAVTLSFRAAWQNSGLSVKEIAARILDEINLKYADLSASGSSLVFQQGMHSGVTVSAFQLSLVSDGESDSASNKSKIPHNLNEAVDALSHVFSSDDKKRFQEWSEKKFVCGLHHGHGRWLRNNWGLWDESSKLHLWFRSIGVWHADDMSGIILTTYYRKAHRLPVKLDEQIEHYVKYWAEQSNVVRGSLGDGESEKLNDEDEPKEPEIERG